MNIPLTVFCRSGVDVAKKTRLETEGATVRLHGEDCVDAELEARRYAQVYKWFLFFFTTKISIRTRRTSEMNTTECNPDVEFGGSS